MNKEKKNTYLMTNLMTDVNMLFTGEQLTLINDILSEYNDHLDDLLDMADTHEEIEVILDKRYRINKIMDKLTSVIEE